MDKVLEIIKQKQLIKEGDIIGVGVSGGRDSIALVHFLNSTKQDLDIEVVAINIDHHIRETSAADSAFVKDFCKKNNIRFYKFDVDALKVATEKKMSIEQSAREARYSVFESLISRGVVDKIALGHHMGDQAETILLNIFRGSGSGGARGMDYIRDNKFIRPFLCLTREEINEYISKNDLSFVEDETNKKNDYSRNFLRNVIMPLLKSKFNSVERNIVSFGNLAAEDNEYINQQVQMGSVIESKDFYKIPIAYFDFPPSIVNRLVMRVLSNFEKRLSNIERKHITLIVGFAKEGENGTKISLPNGIKVFKEYDYITITLENNIKMSDSKMFKKGLTYIDGYGKIIVKNCKKMPALKDGEFVVDAAKIPKNAVWRFRLEGDMFTPFKGPSKKLKEYFIDKKVPLRLRDNIPVLANNNEILIVAGIQISNLLKVDESTTAMYKIVYEKQLI